MKKAPEAFRTISEVAEILDTPAHVLRFWESKFYQIRPVKRAGGRRYYRPDDVALINGIKALLQSQGMTIRGVQRVLQEQGVRHVAGLGSPLPEILPDGDVALEGRFIDPEELPAQGLGDPPDEPVPERPLAFRAPPKPPVAAVPKAEPAPEPEGATDSTAAAPPDAAEAAPLAADAAAAPLADGDSAEADMAAAEPEPPATAGAEPEPPPAQPLPEAEPPAEPAPEPQSAANVVPEAPAPAPAPAAAPVAEPAPVPVAAAPRPRPAPEPLAPEPVEPSERAQLARRLRAMPRGGLGPKRDRAELLARRIDTLLERMSEASGAGRW